MDIPDCVFWDLFSGSGSIAIEALSRGAKRAVLVENSRDAVNVIKQNIHFTKFENEAEVIRMDVAGFLRGKRKVDADVIFIDPPYGKGLDRQAVEELSTKEFINRDAILVVEALLEEDFDYIEDTIFAINKSYDK